MSIIPPPTRDLYREACLQIEAGKNPRDLAPGLQEALLDHAALKFRVDCELEGRNPDQVFASMAAGEFKKVTSAPIVDFDRARRLHALTAPKAE